MNLFMPGGGISETHVTWHDIEESMQHEFQTKATLGPNRTAKDIGDGKGYMSKVFLIDADWKNKDKNLPDKFVLKYRYKDEERWTKNSITGIFQAHNAEVAAYRHLSKLPEGKIQIPKVT
ncbi:unnamed protein product [Haemonchus placei]|uniref:Alpha-amylase n=1 Tax=Haemonchus placei TaxID=6290 RepID=A0A0N4WN58_HAEPC|nr:unnamed protein product [Haemonchus placei]